MILKSMIRKLKMYSLVFYIVSCYFCINIYKGKYSKKVSDIIHDNITPFPDYYISDILCAIQILHSFMYLSVVQLSETLYVMAFIQFLRGVCTLSTRLPSLKRYDDKARFGGLNGTGSEYIFSGHASYCCIASIFLWINNLWKLHNIILYNILSQFLVIVSRNHYTIDIVLAWAITPLTYFTYKYITT